MNDSITQQTITFMLNDRVVSCDVNPDETSLELLRDKLRLTGTKEVCSEGDCGACAIAVGEIDSTGVLRYRAINSCLFPTARMHQKHILTVEGLAAGTQLHPIQQILLEQHGTQCGYCTPGIIMTLFCHFTTHETSTVEELKTALEGNLCRCTGYRSILAAAEILAETFSTFDGKENLYPRSCDAAKSFLLDNHIDIGSKPTSNHEQRSTTDYHTPETINDLFKLLDTFSKPDEFRLIAGGTDIYVERNVQRRFPACFIDIDKIPELKRITGNGTEIRIGATSTYREIIDNTFVQTHFPMLVTAATWVGSSQIRNVATLAGNVAHASPIADGTVALLALDAKLELRSSNGIRIVKIDQFFLDYRKTALQLLEIISAIILPIKTGFSNFIKSSKRIAVDISSVNSACSIQIEGSSIISSRFAFGGVDKIPRLSLPSSEFLVGKNLTTEVIDQCAQLAIDDFTPMTDIRGSAEYRSILIRNHVVQHLTKLQEAVLSGKESK